MAPVFGTIDMLKPGRSTFGLELRLIRCYENSNSGGMECIFHDRQAERIHVTIPGSNFEKFKQRLIEGSVYALIDFVIGMNIMKYRTTSCIHKIIVFKHTRLFEVFHEEFPKCLFELKRFADIAQMDNVGDSSMFDVIGAIVSHYRPQQKEINRKMTKLMDILLEDLEGNTITCTVWEHYVDEVIKFLDSGPEAPVGIILQLCRASIFREFWIHDTIKSIESSNRFSFLACKECLKELQPQDEQKFFCEQCQTFDICGKSRYKLDVKVGDGIEETILDMWDIQGLELIEKKPAEVVYICDALETPPTMKSTTDRKNSADLMNEDETNRKLIDEFSSNALKKRQKRNVKKE
ncbi:hypothetical protein C2S52_016248 [Perilla frutescens var. hirtella]|nr:hypothetical protein C2S52_016248 [Perilla frutescens var. hirtella]